MDNIQKLIYLGDRQFDLVEEGTVAPGAGEVTIDVIASGICGSDVHGYAGSNGRRAPGTVMGHEVVGRVSATGPDVGITLGTLAAVWPIVACGSCDLCHARLQHLCRDRRLYGCTPELPGGFATQMTVPVENIVPLPAQAPVEWGALVEPLAVGYHAVTRAGETLGDVVGVVGGGPIGIAAALAARRRGARDVLVVEPLEVRRRIVERLGFVAVPPDQAPRHLGTVFECVGITATLRSAIELSRPGGVVICIGVAEPVMAISSVAVVIEERSLIGSSAYTRQEFVEVANSLDGADYNLAALIEARTDLEGAPAVFAAYAEGATTAIKTLVIPNSSSDAGRHR